MSFMDILKNKKKNDESEYEKQIRLFKEILNEDSLDEEKEKLLRNLYGDLNNYFLRGSLLSTPFKELIEKDRDKNEKKLYRLFKKLGIKQKNKYATKNLNREAFNDYINFKYDSRLTELEPIIKKLNASNTKSLLDSMEDSELSILFSSKNKILVLELISRIAILEDDIKEETRLQGGKILSEAKDTLESNFEIIVYLYNALDVMAKIREVPSLRVSERSIRRLQEDLDYMSTRGIVLDSSLLLPEEKMDLLRNLYKKKLENPQSFRRTQSPSGEGKLVADENAEQREKDFKANINEELIKISAEIKNLTKVENKFQVYVNLRNRISNSIADNLEGKDVKRIFEQDVEMENIEENITEKLESLTTTLKDFVKEKRTKEKEGLSEEEEIEGIERTIKFFEDREVQYKEIDNLMKTYIELVEKNILPYKSKFGSDKAEYSQRTKFKETKPKQTNSPKKEIHQDKFTFDNISQEDIKELERTGREWLSNYGLSQTKLKLPPRPFGERIDAEKYKRTLYERKPKTKYDPKELSSFIPRDDYTEEVEQPKLRRLLNGDKFTIKPKDEELTDKQKEAMKNLKLDTDKYTRRKKKYKSKSKITTEEARQLADKTFGDKNSSKKKKNKE